MSSSIHTHIESKHSEKSSCKEIILIRPAYGPLDAGFRESRPPAGLLYISAPLVQAGVSVAIIDQTVESNWKERLLSCIGDNTLCVGITCLTGPMILNGINIAKLVREHSKCPIVWGGVHPSLEIETTLKSEYVDIIVRGEGEETFIELVTALKRNEPYSQIDGVAYKKDNQLVVNPERKPYDLNRLPPIPFELCDISLYRGNPTLKKFFRFRGDTAVSIETSRGCTHRCTYCVMANKFYKERAKWRGMSAEKMIETIKDAISKTGARSIAFIDDNFFVDIERINRFIDLLEKEHLEIEWFADIRMDTVAEKLNVDFLKRLEKSGLRSLGIGIETGSGNMLKFLRKGESRDTIVKANRMLSETGIIPNYGFLQGLPTETVEDAASTFTLVAQLLMENPNVGIIMNKLLPTPNTPLFEECVRFGLKKPEYLEEWAAFSDTDWHTGKGVWMEAGTAEFIMSQLHYKRILFSTTPRQKNSIRDFILVLATKLLLFRIRHRFYSFKFEKWAFTFLRTARNGAGKIIRRIN
ncbi:MAG: radical SAM protein [Victivallales bacterium]